MEKCNLLIVDSSKEDHDLIISSLGNFKCNITSAYCCTEADKKLKKQSFDCIVIDFNIDCDAIGFIRELRITDADTPIIFVSMSGDELLAAEAIKSGAQDYIPKNRLNGEINLLKRAIVNAVSQHESQLAIDYYKHFYDTAPVGFYTTDVVTGKFIHANKFCLNLLGFDDLTTLRENLKSTDIYSAKQRQKLLELLDKQKFVTDFEVEINLPDGGKKWIILTARKCHRGDCIEGSATDITDRKLLEKEVAEYRRKQTEYLKDLRRLIQGKLDRFD